MLKLLLLIGLSQQAPTSLGTQFPKYSEGTFKGVAKVNKITKADIAAAGLSSKFKENSGGYIQPATQAECEKVCANKVVSKDSPDPCLFYNWSDDKAKYPVSYQRCFLYGDSNAISTNIDKPFKGYHLWSNCLAMFEMNNKNILIDQNYLQVSGAT